MIDKEEILNYLETNLSTKRFIHSLGVAEEAVRLAKRYSCDTQKAYIAGLVHDCAKELNTEISIALLKDKYNVEITDEFIQSPRLLHGLVGSYLINDLFNISDPEIIDAVRYHTTGKANISLLSAIIYIADYIEPNRIYGDVDFLRKLTYNNLNEGLLYSLEYTIYNLVENNLPIHTDTIHFRNYLLKDGTKSLYQRRVDGKGSL